MLRSDTCRSRSGRTCRNAPHVSSFVRGSDMQKLVVFQPGLEIGDHRLEQVSFVSSK